MLSNIFTLAAALAVSSAPLALAQAAASGTATATAAGATHTVIVGANAQKQYSPNNTVAAIGDLVTFVYGGGNHTVTQSTFKAPCAPIPQNTTTGAVGFDSGFVPATATNMSAFTIQVTAATPIWFYCAQANHCVSGMVGSINAPATGNTYDLYLQNALNSGSATAAASGGAVAASGAGSTAGVGGTLTTGSAGAAAATPTGSAPRNVVALAASALVAIASCMLLA